jgi:release factor glutamine methyltransferase
MGRIDSGQQPPAYRQGECAFYNITVKVTPDVLIPRPDTERLVDVVLEFTRCGRHVKSRNVRGRSGKVNLPFPANCSALRLLDLCCGSGCIGLAVEANSNAVVTYGDISLPALDVARENGCKDVRVLDALNPPAAELHGGFDVLVCNPPYVIPGDTALDGSVLDREPHIALFGGSDGLAFYRSLLPNWTSVLKPGGLFAVEVGYNQAETVARMMREAGLEGVAVRKDYGGVERVVSGYYTKESGVIHGQKESQSSPKGNSFAGRAGGSEEGRAANGS